ncbi:flagellar assembly protein FliH [Barrientosiimonas marina]|uniref:Flagellar assembly protein FliH n=1 Tax=Lentibacillus kimchii TaxID=1542911 RepID=A0ABW2UTE3_9BACI
MSDRISKQSEITGKRRITVRPVSGRHSADATLADASETKHETVQSEIKQAQEELERLKVRQTEVIDQTNAEIEAAQTAWKEEKQTYIEQARQEGYTDGFNQGLQRGQDDYQQLISNANDAVKAAQHDYYKTLDESHDQLLDLAVHIAEKIMHQQLSEQPESLMPLVTSAIQTVRDKSNVALYLNPADYDLISRQKDELTSFTGKDTVLSIYADDTLSEGSCLIEHPFGRIDAGIDAQLQQLRTTLREIGMENDL